MKVDHMAQVRTGALISVEVGDGPRPRRGSVSFDPLSAVRPENTDPNLPQYESPIVVPSETSLGSLD